jgi:putative Mg2+ transporter-C (MgtC) family protein
MLSNEEIIIRLILAAALGSLIGFERERVSWSAGLRTHMLVCVGSCLIMIVSAFGFADILGTKDVVLDPSRIAAQVVSGIGFLGAGAILMQGDTIRGLTTAASVWAIAAIGLAVGSGLYVAAIASTVLILIILAGIKPLEKKYRDKQQSHMLRMLVKRGEMTIDLLQKTTSDQMLHVKQFIVKPSESPDYDDVTIAFERKQHSDVTEIVKRLSQLPCVSEVKEVKSS